MGPEMGLMRNTTHLTTQSPMNVKKGVFENIYEYLWTTKVHEKWR